MARTRIEMPQHFDFCTNIPIRITDINYGGHVGNDAILSLLHEARMQFLKHHGFTEMNFGGVGLIMSDVTIEFKREMFYGDALMAYITASNFSRSGFDIFYKLVKNTEEMIVAIAKTGMVCYDYGNKRIVTMPDEARKSLSPG